MIIATPEKTAIIFQFFRCKKKPIIVIGQTASPFAELIVAENEKSSTKNKLNLLSRLAIAHTIKKTVAVCWIKNDQVQIIFCAVLKKIIDMASTKNR